MNDKSQGSTPPEQRNASAQKDEATFQQFTVEQWVGWLNAFLSYDPCSPVILIGRDELLHHPLIRLYRSLNTKSRRDRFAEAVTEIYQATSLIPENAEQLFYLLQLITYIKPLRAKALLRRDLREGALADVAFGPFRLQRMLLVARTRYDVNDDIADYIYSSCNDNPDLSYMLLCLDILSTRSGDEAYRFIERIMPFIKSEVEAMHLCMQLRADLPITGYRAFYDWYLGAEEGIRNRYPAEMELFKEAIKQLVLPPLSEASSLQSPAYAVLLSAQLQAKERLLMAKELYVIASQYKEVGEEVVVSALSDIWRKTADRDDQGQPWCYDSSDDIPQILWKNTERAISVKAGGTAEFTQHFFDARVEPVIDRLLTAIEDQFVVINEDSTEYVPLMDGSSTGYDQTLNLVAVQSWERGVQTYPISNKVH